MQRVHFQVRVGVFNRQQILPKIFLFRYLWYCDKKQIECGLAWHWWNSIDLGSIDMFLINLNAEIVACILSFRKLRHKPNLQNTSKYGFSPDLGGKMAEFWACACKLSWTLLSPAWVQPLYGAGRKESSGTGLGQGMRGHTAPLHPGIYRVPPGNKSLPLVNFSLRSQ